MNDFDLLTNKADLYQSRWAPSPDVRAPENGVLVEIERFALTANNFTYAKLGDAFGYWRYFPAPEGFGRVPVWGVGRVIESHADGVAEGERVYGFLPISTRCVLTPALRGKLGFVDGAAHRTDLPPAYKEYRLIDREAIFKSRDENAYLALRPVFILGFFLAEWLAEQSFFGCHRIIVSSASSKAAAALVHQLGRRVETVGLTAQRNLAAVASMGLFDKAVAYSQIAGTRRLESGSGGICRYRRQLGDRGSRPANARRRACSNHRRGRGPQRSGSISLLGGRQRDVLQAFLRSCAHPALASLVGRGPAARAACTKLDAVS